MGLLRILYCRVCQRQISDTKVFTSKLPYRLNKTVYFPNENENFTNYLQVMTKRLKCCIDFHKKYIVTKKNIVGTIYYHN